MKPPIYHRTFDYDRARLPNAHLAALETGVTTQAQAEARTGLTIGYPGWGVIYHMLLAHLNPARYEVIIETGTNQGCTTIILAQALVDAKCEGKVITFELNKDNANKARANLEAAGLSDRVDIHIGDSKENLKTALADASELRFAFLDASHMYDDVMTEFDFLLPKLTDDALVLFDNT